MRNLLPLMAISSACTTADPEVVPRMPSATPHDFGERAPSHQPACLIRYNFPGADHDFECRTELVDGDPHHYVTACPVPEVLPAELFEGPPPATREVTLDAMGRITRSVATVVNPSGATVTTIEYFYDAEGRQSEQRHTDGTGEVLFDQVVGDRDAEGRPLTMTATMEPLAIYGVTFLGTAHTASALIYDDDGRLQETQIRFQPSGNLFFDRTVRYDDFARRRDYATMVDVSAEIGDTGPGYSSAYDVLDEAGHVIELENTASQFDSPTFLDNRYEGDRLVTAISTIRGKTTTVSYIYDCP